MSFLRNLLCFCFCLFSAPFALAVNAGDVCTDAGSNVRSGSSAKGWVLVCDGSTYKLVHEFDLSGSVSFAKPVIMPADNSAVCNNSSEGGLMYNSSNKTLQLCNGTSWETVNLSCDTSPSSINFPQITGATTGAQRSSSILQVNGITCGVDVSVSGVGSPQFRICSDSSCSSVVHNWGSANQTVSNGQYMQVRATSSANEGETTTSTVNVGSSVDVFSITTANLGSFKRAFLTTPTRGNFGGVAQADAMCMTQASAAGLSGTFLAWLSSSDMNDPESRFTRHSVPYKMYPTGTVIANNTASLMGGGLVNGLGRTSVDGTTPYHVFHWSATKVDGTHNDIGVRADCSDWTSSDGSIYGGRGRSTYDDSAWSSNGELPCSYSLPIFCVEQ